MVKTAVKTEKKSSLTSGAIYAPMMKFMLPVIAATFLQAMYAAVDLLVIGQFVSTDATITQNATAAVGTGGMIMTLITYVISGTYDRYHRHIGQIYRRKGQTGRNPYRWFRRMYFYSYGIGSYLNYGDWRVLFFKMDECAR